MPISPEKSTVFIVDDDPEFCQSLQWLLESVGLKVKIFNHSFEFLEKESSILDKSGCILLDIRMPQISGLEIFEQLNSQHNILPVIFITGHGDVALAVRAMKLGAFDFLTKPFNDQVLLEQIQKALAYNKKTAPAQQQYFLLNKRFDSLTKREQEVLALIIEGKLNKEIAYLLKISIKTVELHRSHVMEKMHANTLSELVKYYLILKGINLTLGGGWII